MKSTHRTPERTTATRIWAAVLVCALVAPHATGLLTAGSDSAAGSSAVEEAAAVESVASTSGGSCCASKPEASNRANDGCPCSQARKAAGRCCCSGTTAGASSCSTDGDTDECPTARHRCGCSGPDSWMVGADPRIDSPKLELTGTTPTVETLVLHDDVPEFERFAPPTPPPRRRPV